MILSEHALKGNGDKRVEEFLSTLESATSWLDIREYYHYKVEFESRTRVRWRVIQFVRLLAPFTSSEKVVNVTTTGRLSPKNYSAELIV